MRAVGTALDKRIVRQSTASSAVHQKRKSSHAIRSKTHRQPSAFGLLLLTGCSGWEDRDRIEHLCSRPTAQPSPVSSPSGKLSAISGASCGVDYTRNYSYKVWTAAVSQPEITNLAPSGNSQRFSGRVDSVVYAKGAAQHYPWWSPTRKQNTEIPSKLRSIESLLTVCGSWF